MKRFIAILAALTALLISGCEILLGPDEPAGTGTLSIGFGASDRRAVVPTDKELAALHYDLVLTGPGGQKKEASVSAGKDYTGQATLGTWRIEAEARTPDNVLIGRGSATVTVKAGIKNQAWVHMEVVPPEDTPADGTGSFNTPAQYREMVLATPDDSAPVTITGNIAYRWSSGSTWEGVFIAGRTVILSPFQIAKYETTYELWYEVRQWARGYGYTFTNFPGQAGNDGSSGAAPGADKLEPVTSIKWRDAIVWCNAYSEMSGKDPVYYLAGTTDFNDTTKVLRVAEHKTYIYPADTAADKAVMNPNADGYRLPTEAEWEYAARGGKMPSTTGPFAYKWAGANNSTDLKTHAWCSDNAGGNTHPVGGKLPNTLGLHDMTGNVYEWCWDWIVNTINTGTVTNPAGPASPTTAYRILRGGCYTDGADSGNAVAARGSSHPDNDSHNRGFRVVCRP